MARAALPGPPGRAGVGTLVSFHHDPAHSDDFLDDFNARFAAVDRPFSFVPGRAGEVFVLS